MTWRSVGRIIRRVMAEGLEREDALDGLVRIGIDEVSHDEPADSVLADLSARLRGRDVPDAPPLAENAEG